MVFLEDYLPTHHRLPHRNARARQVCIPPFRLFRVDGNEHVGTHSSDKLYQFGAGGVAGRLPGAPESRHLRSGHDIQQRRTRG